MPITLPDTFASHIASNVASDTPVSHTAPDALASLIGLDTFAAALLLPHVLASHIAYTCLSHIAYTTLPWLHLPLTCTCPSHCLGGAYMPLTLPWLHLPLTLPGCTCLSHCLGCTCLSHCLGCTCLSHCLGCTCLTLPWLHLHASHIALYTHTQSHAHTRTPHINNYQFASAINYIRGKGRHADLRAACYMYSTMRSRYY